jgi:hypothetical protein
LTGTEMQASSGITAQRDDPNWVLLLSALTMTSP